jgi:hypothetical protein
VLLSEVLSDAGLVTVEHSGVAARRRESGDQQHHAERLKPLSFSQQSWIPH